MFNKKLIAIILAAFIALSTAAAQQQQGLGVGVIIGEPTGISLKLSGNEPSFAAGLAWSFANKSSLHLHIDYLKHLHTAEQSEQLPGQMPLHYGFGGRLRLRDDNKVVLGFRIPIGLTYLPEKLPLDFFIELVPILDVIPDTGFGLNLAIGTRYYFK